MADLSDVESTLVAVITQAAYPNGTSNPSIIDNQIRIARGWPIPANLDTDLGNGVVNISVFPMGNGTKATRYPQFWQQLPVAAPSMTATASGKTITLAGTPSSPLNVAALVNRKGYCYAVQPSDTLISIATGIAALISVDTPATSSGSVVTVPAAIQLSARVGATGTVVRELRRQKQPIQITFWCATPTARDAIVPPIDEALAEIDFLSLPDGTAGRLLFERTAVSDVSETKVLYRRDLFYSVEYGTTQSATTTQIIAQIFNITGGIDPTSPHLISFDA